MMTGLYVLPNGDLFVCVANGGGFGSANAEVFLELVYVCDVVLVSRWTLFM
jgi:hypothetical protein